MGYYANGGGQIVFYGDVDDAKIGAIAGVLANGFEDVDWWLDTMHVYGPDTKTVFSVSDYDKYHDDEVRDALNDAAQLAPIFGGEICYVGEDACFWRFIWKDGQWVEEHGRVVYESDPGYDLPAFNPFDQTADASPEFSPSDADPSSLFE